MPKFKLKEYRTKTVDMPITDKKILGYIQECIDKMEEIGYDIPRNKINIYQTDATKTFGSMGYDFWGNGHYGYNLRLSKHMFNEPEKAVKNTIYHELCHLVAMEDDIRKGRIYYDDWEDRWKIERGEKQAGHGPRWQRIADKVGQAINDKISRTDSYSVHTGVGDTAKQRQKWTFECPECHTEMSYQRETKFVRDYDKRDPKTGEPYWYCARCKRDRGKKIAFVLVGDNNENN